MLLSTAYNELMHHRPKNSYRLMDGKIFIDSGWIALAIFQSLNKQNFGVVIFCDGNLKGRLHNFLYSPLSFNLLLK